MQRFVTKHGWQEVLQSEVMVLREKKAVAYFRCDGDTRIYVSSTEEFDVEVLAAMGTGDLEVEVVGYAPCYLRFESEGRLWVRREQIDQTTQAVYGTTFVEPMMRPAKSPEIERLERMVRANQIARDRDLMEFRRKFAEMERERHDDRTDVGMARRRQVEEPSGRDAEEGFEDGRGSGGEAEESATDDVKENEAAGADESGHGRRAPSRKGDEGRMAKGRPSDR